MILAASVCTRSGKVLISRQFEDLGADKIQELFSSFGKLAQQGAQHTTIETNDVRYVYEPLEDLFVVLVTDLASNILQDIRTLRLVSQAVAAQVRTPSETDICDSAFEIIGALDEIVNNGYSEDLSLSQVETFLEMESYAEKIQEIIERNKEIEAAETRKQRARELEMQRKMKQRGGFSDGSSSPFVDLGGSTPSYTPPVAAPAPVSAPAPATHLGKKPPGRGGLQLGKKKEESIPMLPQAQAGLGAGAGAGSGSGPYGAASGATAVAIQETLHIEATRAGEVRTARVTGSLHLFAGDRDNATLKIKAATSGPSNAYKTNPKMDRALFASERVLALRNPSEAFPASHVLLLKWTVENVKAPITFGVWVSQSPDAGFLSVTVEYELAEDFVDTIENVNVAIRLPNANAHVVDPSSVYDQGDEHITWMIPVVNSANASGTFEFTAEADSEESFFPLQAQFSIPKAERTFGGIEVLGVESVSGGSVEWDGDVSVGVDEYVIR